MPGSDGGARIEKDHLLDCTRLFAHMPVESGKANEDIEDISWAGRRGVSNPVRGASAAHRSLSGTKGARLQ